MKDFFPRIRSSVTESVVTATGAEGKKSIFRFFKVPVMESNQNEKERDGRERRKRERMIRKGGAWRGGVKKEGRGERERV